MPIYDYRCGECNHVFEKLVMPSKEPKLTCPECESTDVERIASMPTLVGTSAKHDVLQREYKQYRKKWVENAYMPKQKKKKSSE
jgi:putative FmdB family regulatory protein